MAATPRRTMHCPGCAKVLDPAQHGDLVCDGQVWCGDCRRYPEELVRPRDFRELQQWGERICAAFGQAPVLLQHNPAAHADLSIYWTDNICLLAEADHGTRSILLFPPGYRLTSLCHELAHIFTRQDHTAAWAGTFARLVAWVKSQLEGHSGCYHSADNTSA